MLASPFQQVCPEAVLGTGRPGLSLEALTAPLRPCSTHQEGPGDLTRLTRGECPARREQEAASAAWSQLGRGSGKASKWWGLFGRVFRWHDQVWANDFMSQSSVFSSIIFQGNYVIDKGVVLLYRSPLNKKRENNRI